MGMTDNKKAEAPRLLELITGKCSDLDCYSAYVSVRKPDLRFSRECDEVFVSVSPLEEESEGVSSAT